MAKDSKLPPGRGDGKTMAQMWKEFGRFIRANDVKGNPAQQGNVAAARKAKLMGQYGGTEGPKGSSKAKPKAPRGAK
jgi:hypothetical protein